MHLTDQTHPSIFSYFYKYLTNDQTYPYLSWETNHLFFILLWVDRTRKLQANPIVDDHIIVS